MSELREATNIGSELLVSGKITVDQIKIVEDLIAGRAARGVKTRFGEACRELGFVTDEDLNAAEASQARARDTSACNSSDTDSALDVLRNVARASERQTTSRLQALTTARAT
jgi:hypothetical protein